jgi:hypothetical protein
MTVVAAPGLASNWLDQTSQVAQSADGQSRLPGV